MAVDHNRLKQLFISACDLPRESQLAFVESQCHGDRELQDQLDRLLKKDSSTSAASMTDCFGVNLIANRCEERLPSRIGRYQPLRRIGEGGMGVVYLARQENPRRDVAVKMIRAGSMNQQLLQRFEFETHVLGRLQHSNIAQILEAGMHEDESGGRPYFAMEYIDGVPLMEHVANQRPSLRARLGMFINICDAVHHAHQRGVIHRDLKPANILVTASGQPKILDFGIARATDADLHLTTFQTDVGKLFGTLPYMSPEQVTGRGHDVDTRSDIYSLGVILYELLAGRLPYDLTDCPIVEAARIISSEEPTPLATLDRMFRGDLNTIVRKALEKDPDRRYQSALHLAADIERYLRDEPIIARPATTMYQIRKFAQRNRVLVTGAAAVAVALILAIVGTSFGMISAREQALEADRQREIAEAVNKFLNDDLLGSANPNTGEGRDVTVRAVLDLAAENIDERFRDQPLVAASIRITLGRTYFALAMHEDAEYQFREAVEIYTNELGHGAEDTINARRLQGMILRQLWRLDEAEAMLTETLAIAEQSLGSDHDCVADVLGELAVIHRHRGRYSEAEHSYRRAIAIYDQSHEPEHRRRRITMNNLALLLAREKRFGESEALYRELLAVTRQAAGPRHADTAFVLLNYTDVLWRQGKHDEAEPLSIEAYDIRREVLGEDHPETIRALYSLGLLHRARGDYAQAEQVQRQVLDARLRRHDAEHPDVLISRHAIATLLKDQGRIEEAIAIYRDVLAIRTRVLGVFDVETSRTGRSLYALFKQKGDEQAIRTLLVDTLDAMRREAELPSASLNAVHNWARQLLAVEFEDLRDPGLAVQAAQRAAAMSDQQNPSVLHTLAVALDQNNQQEQAIATLRSAIALLDSVPEPYEGFRSAAEALLDELLASTQP